jgi:hypothetical protein
MQCPREQRNDRPVASRCQHFACFVPTSRHVRPLSEILEAVSKPRLAPFG